MYVCAVDAIAVAVARLGGDELPQFLGGNAFDAQIDGFAVHMLAVFVAFFVGVPLLAAQAGDNVCWLSEICPGGIGDFDHRLLHLGGVAVTELPAALALELLPGEIADILPPVSESGCCIICNNWLIPGGDYLQNPLFRGRPEDAVHVLLRHVGPLEVNGCPLGILAPQPIQRAVVVAQIGKQCLLLFQGHWYYSKFRAARMASRSSVVRAG